MSASASGIVVDGVKVRIVRKQAEDPAHPA